MTQKPRDRRTIFNPSDFDPQMKANRMATAAKKRSRKSAKPAETPKTKLPPDDDPDPERADFEADNIKLAEERDKYKSKCGSIIRQLKKAQNKVTEAAAEFEKADKYRKACRAAHEQAVAAELMLVSRITSGEQELPFPPEEGESTGQPTATAETPVGDDHAARQSIDALLAKNIKKTVGKEAFDDAKAKEQPIGLSDKQLEILVAADIKTIGDLEKRISADALFLKNLKGFGEKNIDRLTDTLLAYRLVFPVPAAPEVHETGPTAGLTTEQVQTPTDPAPEAPAEATPAQEATA